MGSRGFRDRAEWRATQKFALSLFLGPGIPTQCGQGRALQALGRVPLGPWSSRGFPAIFAVPGLVAAEPTSLPVHLLEVPVIGLGRSPIPWDPILTALHLQSPHLQTRSHSETLGDVIQPGSVPTKRNVSERPPSSRAPVAAAFFPFVGLKTSDLPLMVHCLVFSKCIYFERQSTDWGRARERGTERVSDRQALRHRARCGAPPHGPTRTSQPEPKWGVGRSTR